MKILVLSNTHLNCNTGGHIVNAANALSLGGVSCVVCVPREEDISPPDIKARFGIVHARQLLETNADELPDLIYVWTPREANRKTLAKILERQPIPYVVHFEDNEYHLTRTAFEMGEAEFSEWKSRTTSSISVPDHLSDPTAIRAIVERSAGVTALVDELLELIPRQTHSAVFWPGYDESLAWGMPPDLAYRRSLGLRDEEFVVAYTGNMHSANAGEVRSLYLAVALLNRRGLPVRLVRTGHDHSPLTDHGEDLLRRHSLELGFVAKADLPRLLSISDVLVQPGCPDEFNLYRFPSKLPEFLASGRPVVLPVCNIGAYLENGREAIVLPRSNALEITRTLEKLLPDAQRRHSIGEAGAAFAAHHLRWSKVADKLLPFFRVAIAHGASSAVPPRRQMRAA